MASYQYEQLNDETFQQLCQSLLLKVFPNLQCLAVGQPDGGRDAIARLYGLQRDMTGFMLFQVKFARRELNPSEARDWLDRTLKEELPKVAKQIDQGAERFMLITNVPGTAHPEAGSVDKLQALLEEQIPIPAEAWWREDLDRRLDDAWNLKFAYPALFSRTDLLRLILEASPSEGKERREIALTAFLSDQCDSDREVKFKQAELDNDIFDLFVDVPIAPRNPSDNNPKMVERLAAAFRRVAESESGNIDPARVRHWLDVASGDDSELSSYNFHEEAWLGAASLLLDSEFHEAEPFVVLEGAPGQGKSTIAQYICQVHRVRILDNKELTSAYSHHISSSLRLPFKVELRDFADWMTGRNPFSSDDSDHPVEVSSKSLEAFLSVLVQYASGGSDFTVLDLQQTLRSSPSLIVLDGLDEVAEINQRQRVVEEIIAAVTRLKAIAPSLQVLVTSRPTAFTNSTVLPRRIFATYSLDSLTRPLVSEYAERWLRSRDIDEADADEVREVLKKQADEPHLRDLARNPMQLTILLSLIHRRGVSLPDKRTALYDNYVDMFFDRESEKAPVVKENRDLLIRIHRYLAWILHSSAEASPDSTSTMNPSGGSLSGTITENDLTALLRDFLEKDGSDPNIVETLFTGMVERVVAIVSRVQGRYEFDVQTLREYFAARYLYETAPYSPTGDQRPGTISDRWHALSRNYYWLNVARFYAGCYSEGELLSLIDGLRALSEDDVFRYTSHPQLLTATLLSDWVFSQKPRALEDAVDLILEPRGLRRFVATAGYGRRGFAEVIVRDHVGRQRLVAKCKDLVRSDLSWERVMDVVWSVLGPNSDPEELVGWWIDEFDSIETAEMERWCTIGEHLRCWSVVNQEMVSQLLGQERIPSSRVIAGLLHANRMDIIEGTEEMFQAAMSSVLSGEWIGLTYEGSILQKLAWSIEPRILNDHQSQIGSESRISLREYQREFLGYVSGDLDVDWPNYDAAQRCARYVQTFARTAELSLSEWNTSTEPWDQIVRHGVSEFGERPIFVELANLAAGIRSSEDQCQDSRNLFDTSQPLVRRARYARLRAGSRNWWLTQMEAASCTDETWMVLLLFATWAGARTTEMLSEEFDELVTKLEFSDWCRLHSSLRRVAEINSDRPWVKPLGIRSDVLPSSLSARSVALLAVRCTTATVDELYECYLSDYSGNDPNVISLRADIQFRHALAGRTEWSRAIAGLRASYGFGAPHASVFFRYPRLVRTLPEAVAREIVDHPFELPPRLVQAAEARCRRLDVSRILPVGRVANAEGWFTD